MMAIRVLLDYDVPEENIQLVSLLMAEIGVHSIAYAFPKVCLLFIFTQWAKILGEVWKYVNFVSKPKQFVDMFC